MTINWIIANFIQKEWLYQFGPVNKQRDKQHILWTTFVAFLPEIENYINVGILTEKDGIVKPVRGKSMVVRVLSTANTHDIVKAAVAKHSVHDRFFDGDQEVIFKSRLWGLDGVSKSAHELVPVRGAAEDWNLFMQGLWKPGKSE